MGKSYESKNCIQKIQIYFAPQLEHIEIDIEIALQLKSIPPKAPWKAKLISPEYFSNDSFKANPR